METFWLVHSKGFPYVPVFFVFFVLLFFKTEVLPSGICQYITKIQLSKITDTLCRRSQNKTMMQSST